MNLLNPFRLELSRIPYLNDLLDTFMAKINGVWKIEHNDDGTHGDVTADSLTVSGDMASDGTVTGDADGTPVVVGTSLPSVPLSAGIRIGSSTDGLVLARKVKGGHFTGSGTYAFGLYDLAQSSDKPVIECAKDGSAFVLTDGGTGTTALTLGNSSRPLAAVYLHGYSAGTWTTPSYSSSDFTASSGTWTVDSGDIATYAYTLIANTMTLAWDIASTDVSAGSVLRLAIPGGFTAAKSMYSVHRASDAGGATVVAICRVNAAGTYVELFSTAAGGTWTITAGDNTSTQGQITFEVQ